MAASQKYLHSADNPQYKRLKKIADSARARRESGLTLLDGPHLLQACAEAAGDLESLVLRKDSADSAELLSCIQAFPYVPRIVLSPALFNVLSPVRTPAGIIGVLKIPAPLESKPDCAVLLENVQDPGNLGAILRTAAAAGANDVYMNKGCAEAWSPKVLRAAMGAHFLTTLYEEQNLGEIAKHFAHTFATDLAAPTSLYEIDLRGRVAFLFGNEGAGLSPELRACASQRVHIPMPGKIESLNVAAAAAICLFERVRQLRRGFKPD